MALTLCRPLLIAAILQLLLDYESEFPLILAKTRQTHFFRSGHAALELEPAALHMLDFVVVTWVYVEHRRRERDRGAIYGPAGIVASLAVSAAGV